jgi:hypothetical protein
VKWSRVLVGSILFAGAPLAVAHDLAPTHGCVAPTRPASQEPAVWNPFVDAVDRYRACMNAFIEANHAASERHRAAANQATAEWNAFVRGSLNVPADYPWPPADLN